MNAPASRFRLMADRELQDAAARLEATVRSLAKAQGEIGARIRHGYEAALDEALAELERRRT